MKARTYEARNIGWCLLSGYSSLVIRLASGQNALVRLFLFVCVCLLFTACNRENENLVRATALHPIGREVFDRYNCVRCHNAGQGGYGKRLIGDANLRDTEFIKNRILHGKIVGTARMPPFTTISKQELEDVAKFVRALAGFE